MPIRFPCPECRRKLKAQRAAAGSQLSCPACGHQITVPVLVSADATQPMRNVVRAAEHEQLAPSYGQYVVYEDEEVDFETGEVTQLTAIDWEQDHCVTVPRHVIYVQGALLGTVSLVGFMLGLLCGSSFDRPASEQTAQRGIFGSITYVAETSEKQPDIGAVILVLPADKRPDEKIPPITLRPDQPPPPGNHPSRTHIASWGGYFVRADANGKYRIPGIPPGPYFTLFLSGNAKRESDKRSRGTDLAEIGRYILSPTDLVGDFQYRWQRRELAGEHQWDVHFGADLVSR